MGQTLTKLRQTTEVRRTAIILVVATQLRIEHLLLMFQRIMKMFPTPFGDGDKPSPQALLHRAQMQRESPCPASATPVRETQEIKSSSLGLLPSRLVVGTTPEFHQSGLVRVKRQTILREPLWQNLKNTFRILLGKRLARPRMLTGKFGV